MKRVYRIISMMVALLMLTSLFAGCGSDKAGGEASATQPTTAEAAKTPENTEKEDPFAKYAPIEGKTYKINWGAPIQGGLNVENDAKMVQYWNKELNIELNIINYDNDTINIKIAAGEVPDVFNVRTTNDFIKYVDDDIIGELPDELLQKYFPNMWEGMGKELPGYWKDNLLEGKRYGIAWINENAPYAFPIVWRGDWLKNVGIDKVPTTLDEIETALYKFAKEDPDKNGKPDTYGLSLSALQAVYAAYGYIPAFRSTSATSMGFWTEREGQVVYGGVQPEMKEAVKRINKWYNDRVLDPEFVTGENTGGYWAITHAFGKGRVGLTSHGFYYHYTPPVGQIEGGVNYNELKINCGDDAAASIAFGEPLVGMDGKQRMGACGKKYWGAYQAIASKVFKDEPDKVGKILEFIDTVNAKDYETVRTARVGIEGEDWQLSDEGLITLIDAQVGGPHSGGGVTFAFQPLPTFLKALDPIRFKWADANPFNVGVVDNLIQWPLPADLKYKTELLKIEEEAYMAMITGQKPVDYFDEFVKNWMAAGGEQYTKEANEWYATQKK